MIDDEAMSNITMQTMFDRDANTKTNHAANLLTIALMLVNDGYDDESSEVVTWLKDAAAEIERLTKPIDLNSDEGFVIRALRTAAERTDAVLITANDGERLGLKECGSYAAKPSSKAVLALLDRLEKGVTNG